MREPVRILKRYGGQLLVVFAEYYRIYFYAN